MSSSKKLLQSASGFINQSGGEVGDGLFKTHLYLGTASSLAINNGVDLSGEGGLVILTSRNASGAGLVFDTERGAKKKLELNITNEVTRYAANELLESFNSDGFTISSDSANDGVNSSNTKYVSWTFRKAPKFFDIVTYTGNGTAGRTISHSLNTTVGAVIIKNLTDYGAFVDLGGVDGLLHITDMSWKRIKHPSDDKHIYEFDYVIYKRSL